MSAQLDQSARPPTLAEKDTADDQETVLDSLAAASDAQPVTNQWSKPANPKRTKRL